MQIAPFESAEAGIFWRYIASSLDRLVAVGTALGDDGLHWRPPAPDTNSVATLIVHTLGNAEENILAVLAGEPVTRDRGAEFAGARLSSEGLSDRWRTLRPRLEAALIRLSSAELDLVRRHPRRGALTGREVLIVVARHAAEHLGQAELTRDLWIAGSNC